MSKIKELDKDLINKIAAGEVIERPASVVKELVENAIDAEATHISIEVIEGGKSLVKVSDNGSGIEKDDVVMSIQRHTTSKLNNLQDLFQITTLGFRGEALASIASIAKLEMITKTKENDVGVSITVENGIVLKQEYVSAKQGTMIAVSDLFYNVPARKKHLKGIAVEFNHIIDIITRYALIHPEMHFLLTHNGKTIINSPSTTDLLNNIITIYGRDLTKEFLAVNFANGDVEINGYIGKPNAARTDKEYQSLYINKRYIKNYVLNKAVYDGYGTFLFHGRHPIFILNITILPQKVDVNVHPSKSIVRVDKEYLIYEAIKKAVIDCLVEENLIPEVIESRPKEIDAKLILSSAGQFIEYQTAFTQAPSLLPLKQVLNIRLIGKIHNTFIIAEDEKGMLLIDQHAAHERVMYEKFLQECKDKHIHAQQLLTPIVLHVTPNERVIIEQNIELLQSTGFNLELFGNDSYLLRSLPSVFGRTQQKQLIYDVIDELNLGETVKIEEIKEERIARAACRSAVKAHDVLEFPEIYRILEELFQCENKFTCPHGRPAIIHYSLYELEKKFKRKE
ncbi:DNA mismatch repair endonuclease MutL [Candidatus Woesearchaeota archaeon]|nr:DNA mismatch repair endonuclease MutL [Candidatus Woesearchaeota archaeon]